MNLKNKSVTKISPLKPVRNTSISREQPLLKGKWDRVPSAVKSSQSTKSLSARAKKDKSYNTPLKDHNLLSSNNKISKEYTKSTFNRYQQKLNIQQKIEELIG